MLVGNVVALLSPLIFIPILTYMAPFKPQRYDWVSMALISKGDDADTEHGVDPERADDAAQQTPSQTGSDANEEKKTDCRTTANVDTQPEHAATEQQPIERVVTTSSFAEDRKKLDHAAKWARFLCIALALCFIVLWPMPLFGSGYVFSRPFFTGWAVVGIIWLFCSAGVVVFLPLWQSRRTIAQTTKGIMADLSGHGSRSKALQ